jgi:hypothetical protein
MAVDSAVDGLICGCLVDKWLMHWPIYPSTTVGIKLLHIVTVLIEKTALSVDDVGNLSNS